MTRTPPQVTVDARMLNASGIGTYLRNLMPRVVAARPDWTFHVLGDPDELRREAWAQSGSVRPIACRAPIYSLREQVLLPWRTPSGSDLFWAPHYNFPLNCKSRLLVTIHDLCHLAVPESVRGPHRRAYAQFMFRAVRRRASSVLCVSEFTRAEFLRLVRGNGRPPTTIHNGLDGDWFRVSPGPSPHPRPYILYVGNVKPHKNLGTLVRAFGELLGLIPHDLVIVGRRDGLITVDRSVAPSAAPLGDRVRFTGEVARPELEQFFAHADVFAFPSRYEGFGFPPLEAMACGCPTVVARAASLPEVCGEATLYFDPFNPAELAAALRRVLSDPALRRLLVERGRRQAATYSWDRCARETVAVMEGVLAG